MEEPPTGCPPETSSPKNSPSASVLRKDLERFVKFFLIKSAQVILQSRINCQRVQTECRPPPAVVAVTGGTPGPNSSPDSNESQAADWFNLPIPDHAEILGDTHRVLLKSPECLCLEVSIRRDADETLVLEIWTLRVNRALLQGVKDVYWVYYKLGLMLKTLLCITRVTPAYKIARRRSDYEICYKISGDTGAEVINGGSDPELHKNVEQVLGEKYKKMSVGKVSVGTDGGDLVQVDLSYRTKMELVPEKHAALILKSDHFQEEERPHVVKPAFHDVVIGNSEEDDSEDNADDGGLVINLRRTAVVNTAKNGHCDTKQLENNTKEEKVENNNNNSDIKDKPVCPAIVTVESESSSSSNSSMRLPFASTYSSSSETDLLTIFEDFRLAPALFSNESSSSSSIGPTAEGDLAETVQDFEKDVPLFEEFVNHLLN